MDDLSIRGVELMMEALRVSLERFGVRFDSFFSERSLHEKSAIQRAIDLLAEDDRIYPSEGAVWLRTSAFGDDKDRVLMRSNGDFTYFASDIAYHEDKLERGADRYIDVWGADHHGYVKRVLAAWEALGGKPGTLELLIMQLVNLLERGKRLQMSKRSGEFVTLDDLVDDIGVDAARFFLLQRSHDTTLDLDLALAREQSQDNPVYYVQYAHARIASILRKVGDERVAGALRSDLFGDAPPLGARAAEAPAPAARRGGQRRAAPRPAPSHRLRARRGAGLLGLLPRLPRGGRCGGGRRRGLPRRAQRDGPAGDRPLARSARGLRAGSDVTA